MRRSSSRLTSGRSSTPRTKLKMAAFAPMPSASVSTTVIASPLVRASERAAILKSLRSDIAFFLHLRTQVFRSISAKQSRRSQALAPRPQRNQCAQPAIAQVQSEPQQHAQIGREQDVAEERIAYSQMRSDRAAKVACQQDRPEDRSTRKYING